MHTHTHTPALYAPDGVEDYVGHAGLFFWLGLRAARPSLDCFGGFVAPMLHGVLPCACTPFYVGRLPAASGCS
jgi:hypothetical protein